MKVMRDGGSSYYVRWTYEGCFPFAVTGLFPPFKPLVDFRDALGEPGLATVFCA